MKKKNNTPTNNLFIGIFFKKIKTYYIIICTLLCMYVNKSNN